MKPILKSISVAACIGMFLVLIMGALVTKTESGQGCGEDWPLCNGKFIPSYTVESMVEYSHRFVTGIEGLLVVAAFVGTLRYTRRKDGKFFAGSALFFTVVQAGLGAMAVVWPQSAAVLALHFGISLLAFASTFLQVISLRLEERGNVSGPLRLSGSPNASVPIDRAVRTAVWMTSLYCYFVVYLGAFVRHTKSGGGCSGWPLCNGQAVPELTGATAIVFTHRVAALLLFFALAWLVYLIGKKRQPESVYAASRWALFLVILQIFSGALVTFMVGSDSYLFADLLHTVIVTLLFAALAYLCVAVTEQKPKENA
jgi:cytochrome c oxidase assembly protein subunit 15